MNQTKHIAFLAPNLNGGGLERVVVNLLKGMVKHNLKLDLVLTSATGPLLEYVPPEVRIIDLQTPLGVRLKTASQVISPLAKYLRQEQPDVVLSHLLTYNIVAVVAVTLAKFPTYLTLVEHLSLHKTKNRMLT
ncbi:MAG: glycosyltransferase [Phormidium sp.]